MRALFAAAVLLAWFASACGDECVRVDVDTSAFTVPDELDALHFRLLDLRGLFTERSFDLASSEETPGLDLCRGDRTSRSLRLVVLGLHQRVVVSSAPEVTIDFDGPELVEVDLPR